MPCFLSKASLRIYAKLPSLLSYLFTILFSCMTASLFEFDSHSIITSFDCVQLLANRLASSKRFAYDNSLYCRVTTNNSVWTLDNKKTRVSSLVPFCYFITSNNDMSSTFSVGICWCQKKKNFIKMHFWPNFGTYSWGKKGACIFR